MFTQRLFRPEQGKETVFLMFLMLVISDMVFNSFVSQNHPIFFCEPLELYDQLRRIRDINDKDSEEHSDEEGKARFCASQFSPSRMCG